MQARNIGLSLQASVPDLRPFSKQVLVCSTIDSSTSRSWSLPKNISFPTKKVGEPNAPRLTASVVRSINPFLTSSCCARAINRSISMPEEMNAFRKVSRSSIFFGSSHI